MPRPVRMVVQEMAVVGAALGCVLLSHPTGFPWSGTAAIVACVALPLRLKWPWLAMLFCLWGLAGELGLAPALVGLYRIGRTARSPWLTAAWATAAVVTVETTVLTINPITLRDGTLSILFSILWMTSPSALGMLVTTRQKLATSLAELHLARESELEARAARAKAQERARIAQEIHDAVGHHATLIAVEAAALAATTSEPDTKLTARRIRGQAKASLAEMRSALGLATEGTTGGLPELPRMVNQARDAGMSINFNYDVNPVIAEPLPTVGRAAFRIIQEALTNAAKHAPGAPVEIAVLSDTANLTVTVTSGPIPTQPPTVREAGGRGIPGMTERATTAGGHLDVRTDVDGTFTVRARFPLAAEPTPPKVALADPTKDGTQNPANTR